MAEQKPKREKEVIITSPKGVAKWAKLNKPDTMFKPEGEYSITLLLDPNDPATQPFVDSLEKSHEVGFKEANKVFMDAQKTKKKTPLVKKEIKCGEELTKEGEPTGKIAVSFKCKAGGERKDGTKWAFRPPVYDAKGGVIPSDVLIFGGSVVKVAFSIRYTPMKTGLFYTSFNLKAVQVLSLKTTGDREAGFYGFSAEEDGYEADDAPDLTDEDAASASAADGGDDF